MEEVKKLYFTMLLNDFVIQNTICHSNTFFTFYFFFNLHNKIIGTVVQILVIRLIFNDNSTVF